MRGGCSRYEVGRVEIFSVSFFDERKPRKSPRRTTPIRKPIENTCLGSDFILQRHDGLNISDLFSSTSERVKYSICHEEI